MKKNIFLKCITVFIALFLLWSCEDPVAPAPPAPEYTVSFLNEQGTGVLHTEVLDQEPYRIQAFPDITPKAGYNFAGWFTALKGAGEVFTLGTEISGDTFVYPYWSTITYTVTFDSQGADNPAVPGSVEATSPDLNIGVLPHPPEKTGYDFAGWYSRPQGAGDRYYEYTEITSDMALYAYWADYVYTVRFDVQGAESPAIANAEVISPATNLFTMPADPVKTGFIFGGWYSEPEGQGTKYNAATTISADTVLFAYWEKYDYVVDFNSVGATVAATPAKMHVMSPAVSIVGLPVPPEKSGFRFGGWFTREDGDGLPFSASTIVTSNITVFPKWNSYTYSVEFDSTGGSAADPGIIQVTSPAEKLAALPAVPVKSGYKFGGWFTKAGGEGTKIDLTSKITDNMIVYAHWLEVRNTVTFDSQEADVAAVPASKEVVSPATTLVSMPTVPVKEGYEFGGWFTEPRGGGTEVLETTAITKAMTVYAYWKSYNYRVTFNSQEADTAATPAIMNVASPHTSLGALPADPVKEGFIFFGWNTKPKGEGVEFNEVSVVTKDTTVYAFWGQYVHVVTFDSRGADSGDPANVNIASPATTLGTLPPEPVKSGFVFNGWFTAPEGGGTQVNANTEITADITLYAYWLEYGYQVRFDSQGADTAATPGLKTVVSPKTTLEVLPSEPVKTGFIFGGWYTKVGGEGSLITASTTITKDHTLYAYWISYDYEIVFNSQGATIPASPASVHVKSPATTIATLPSDPVKTGYIFGGWFNGTAASSTQITEATTITSGGTVYAKWISYDYTVTFDSQGAETPAGYASKQIQSPATTIGTLPAEPVKSGFTFCGWFTGANGTGTEYMADTVITSDVDLFAYWRNDVTILATVHIPSPKVFSISNDNAVVNKGETIAFSVDSDIFWRYEWCLDQVTIGGDSSTLIINTAGLDPKLYTLKLTVTGLDGLSDSTFIRFRVAN